ncbi:flagellar biosynthesis protein FlhG [Glaciimonas sp. Gout2]|uniref:MinD/ParA family ATP-binding protein n=1 Tax=unclassified Glaciimonas TaxID=2644401 RepID=UPI002B23CF1D|nr:MULTISPECIES: flagellar biosynthesis protein FlhG [unclassified Glaciimonas]MEB0013904.1 flagellar biosynthesis protein FlhG [Glaciimonas sp. Cout2]MEB0083839.1 flagellar biosynthesis protein FlhG [Glaciimonas sp. Gout2]
MIPKMSDQADGLRAMMAQSSSTNVQRMIAVVGSGRKSGATTVVMNLAAALTQQGQHVLLIDESVHHTPSPSGTASAIWQVDALGNWSDVVSGRLSLDAAGGRAACGVQVLIARRELVSKAVSATGLQQLRQDQIILIDAALGDDGTLSPLACQADYVMVVLQPQPASITAAYACIKRLHHAHALQQVRIVLNGAASDAEASRILTNLAVTGSRYLAVSVEPAGAVMTDLQILHAQQLHLTVVEAFKRSTAALTFRRIAADLMQWSSKARSDVANGDSSHRTAMPELLA